MSKKVHKLEIPTYNFSKEYYVEDDTKPQGTFLEQEFGKGLYFKNPGEILAYSFFMNNKDLLTNEETNSGFTKEMLFRRVDRLVDFPFEFSRENLFSAVKKTLIDGAKGPKDFMTRLDANIDFKDRAIYSYKTLKDSLMARLKKVIEINKDTTAEDIILQISSIETPPAGYTKNDILLSALSAIDRQRALVVGEQYKLFKHINFSDRYWMEKMIFDLQKKKSKAKGDIAKYNEEIDACYRLGALIGVEYDVRELMLCDQKAFKTPKWSEQTGEDDFDNREFSQNIRQNERKSQEHILCD